VDRWVEYDPIGGSQWRLVGKGPLIGRDSFLRGHGITDSGESKDRLFTARMDESVVHPSE